VDLTGGGRGIRQIILVFRGTGADVSWGGTQTIFGVHGFEITTGKMPDL